MIPFWVPLVAASITMILKKQLRRRKRRRLNSRPGVGVAVSVGVAVADGVSDGPGTEINPRWCGEMIVIRGGTTLGVQRVRVVEVTGYSSFRPLLSGLARLYLNDIGVRARAFSVICAHPIIVGRKLV